MVERNHEKPENNRPASDSEDDDTSGVDERNWPLSRRSTMKLFGAAGVASIPLTTSVAADTHGEYETITVPAGQRETLQVPDGGTLSNKLIDITASGASVRIDARGTDWTVRNIGVKGTMDAYDDIALLVGGERGTVENVYLGDGCTPGRSKGSWVDHSDTDGPIEFRNVHIAGFPNNGIYGSPTANLQGGIIHIRDSYFDSNNISQFKIGSPLGTCEVTNTVIRTDNAAPHNGFNQINKRGLWALDGKTVVRDCDILGSIDTYASATVELENTRWDGTHTDDGTVVGSSSGSPDLSPPEGCPMTPEEAAAGSATTESKSIEDVWLDSESNHVALTGGATAVADYRIVGYGTVEFGEKANTGSDDPYADTVTTDGDQFTIRGYLGGATDDFHIDGKVSTVEINGTLSATVNDISFDPTALEGVGTWDGGSTGESGSDGDNTSDETQLTKTVVIDGSQAPEETIKYTVSVSGEIVQSDELTAVGDTQQPWDSLQSVVTDGRVIGIVGNGQDGYRYSGTLTGLEIQGNADVTLDETS